MALPAHLHCLWGETSMCEISHVLMHDFVKFFSPHNHFWILSSPGDNHAGILAEAVWWQKNTVIYSCPVLIYLHLHKDISMTQIHSNSISNVLYVLHSNQMYQELFSLKELRGSFSLYQCMSVFPLQSKWPSELVCCWHLKMWQLFKSMLMCCSKMNDAAAAF